MGPSSQGKLHPSKNHSGAGSKEYGVEKGGRGET